MEKKKSYQSKEYYNRLNNLLSDVQLEVIAFAILKARCSLTPKEAYIYLKYVEIEYNFEQYLKNIQGTKPQYLRIMVARKSKIKVDNLKYQRWSKKYRPPKNTFKYPFYAIIVQEFTDKKMQELCDIASDYFLDYQKTLNFQQIIKILQSRVDRIIEGKAKKQSVANEWQLTFTDIICDVKRLADETQNITRLIALSEQLKSLHYKQRRFPNPNQTRFELSI